MPEQPIQQLVESTKRTVIINAYERNTKDRLLCIQHWKAVCVVYSFDFEEKYGEIGREIIHVHHLMEISKIGEAYQADPIKDIIPFCPNCHAMLHRKEDTMDIENHKANVEEDMVQLIGS